MTTSWATLTAFQRDLLRELAAHDSPKGLTLFDTLEAEYIGLSHARVYQNLDVLIEADLVTKHEVDGRTNAYELTEAGRTQLTTATRRQATAIDLEAVESKLPNPEPSGGDRQ